MNSETWLVTHRGSIYVAKQVAAEDVSGLIAGCEAASALGDAGFVTGRPVRTVDGRLLVPEHRLALLEHVPGRELVGETGQEQEWIARTLAGVHSASGPAPGPGTATFFTDWVSLHALGVQDHHWLPPIIEAVRAELDTVPLTWTALHGDPAPEAFIHDVTTGTTGLIDWAGARPGPVLYDVASAVMYLGGPLDAATFIDNYARHGPLPPEEMALLDPFRRFRFAVQASYFARRLAKGDLTGIADGGENEQGLANARRGLTDLGLNTD